jgi:hypothetical protein
LESLIDLLRRCTHDNERNSCDWGPKQHQGVEQLPRPAFGDLAVVVNRDLADVFEEDLAQQWGCLEAAILAIGLVVVDAAGGELDASNPPVSTEAVADRGLCVLGDNLLSVSKQVLRSDLTLVTTTGTWLVSTIVLERYHGRLKRGAWATANCGMVKPKHWCTETESGLEMHRAVRYLEVNVRSQVPT